MLTGSDARWSANYSSWNMREHCEEKSGDKLLFILYFQILYLLLCWDFECGLGEARELLSKFILSLLTITDNWLTFYFTEFTCHHLRNCPSTDTIEPCPCFNIELLEFTTRLNLVGCRLLIQTTVGHHKCILKSILFLWDGRDSVRSPPTKANFTF